MQPQPEPLPSLLARLDEAALYHRAEDRGFFTLLWAEPDAAPGHRPPVLKIQRAYRRSWAIVGTRTCPCPRW